MSVSLAETSQQLWEAPRDYAEDAELVERFCSGDEQAFSTLVDRHRSQLEATARSIVYGADVDDVTQRAWITIYRKLDSLREPRLFVAWANRITVNAALMFIRKQKRRRETSMDAVPQFMVTDDGEQGAEELTHWRELIERTRGWMEDLDARDRQIFEYFLVDGMTMEQIGDEVGLSTGGVKVRLYRARQELRKLRDAA